MTEPKKEKNKSPYAKMWGLAKSPELSLDKDELYSLIYRETGKEHMNDMSQEEIEHIERVLAALKGGKARKAPQRRTDVGGRPQTIRMRRKIYMLTGTLGWNNDNSRINGFCKKTCGVDRIEWLTIKQCSMVIEGLKKIIEREAAESGEQEAQAEGN